MFDLGWDELLLIGLVALVVIGPKDLPAVLRTMGQWMAKARAMAREFQNHVDDMIRESEVDEMKREFNAIARPPEIKEIEDQLMAGNLPEKPLQKPADAPAPTEAAAAPADAAAPVPASEPRPQ